MAHKIITITREYGSGGRLIAKKVAEALNIAFYDNELIDETARELGIDEDKYIAALQKVNVKTSEEIHASADLLGDVINMFVRASYTSYQNSHILSELKTGISNAAEQLQTANDKVKQIDELLDEYEKERREDILSGIRILSGEIIEEL